MWNEYVFARLLKFFLGFYSTDPAVRWIIFSNLLLIQNKLSGRKTWCVWKCQASVSFYALCMCVKMNISKAAHWVAATEHHQNGDTLLFLLEVGGVGHRREEQQPQFLAVEKFSQKCELRISPHFPILQN